MRKCSKCYYYDQCLLRKVSECDYYTPIDDEITDREVRRVVNRGRSEYYEAYLGYLDAFYNS